MPRLLLATAAILALALSSCGDDESSNSADGLAGANGPANSSGSADSGATTVETASLTRKQFIKQAEKVCAEEREKMGEALFALEDQQGDALFVAGKDSILIPGVEAEVEAIRDIGAPRGDEAEVEAMLAALEEGAQAASSDSVKDFEDFAAQFGRFDRLAVRYGLTRCKFE